MVEPGSTPSPAPHGARIAAFLVDTMFVAALLVIALAVGLVLANTAGRGSRSLATVLVLLPPFLMHPWYYIWSLWKTGATPGKRSVGLAVVHSSGEPMSLRTAIIRYFGLLLSTLTFGLGHLAAFARSDRRALHDHVAGTVVVETARVSARSRMIWAVTSIACLVCLAAVVYLGVRKMTELMQVASEQATKANLAVIASAVNVYAGDHAGRYPGSLSTDPASPFSSYLDGVPPVRATHAGIGKGRAESPSGAEVLITTDERIDAPGQGWRYNPRNGRVFVNSSATDSRGIPYSAYGY